MCTTSIKYEIIEVWMKPISRWESFHFWGHRRGLLCYGALSCLHTIDQVKEPAKWVKRSKPEKAKVILNTRLPRVPVWRKKWLYSLHLFCFSPIFGTFLILRQALPLGPVLPDSWGKMAVCSPLTCSCKPLVYSSLPASPPQPEEPQLFPQRHSFPPS